MQKNDSRWSAAEMDSLGLFKQIPPDIEKPLEIADVSSDKPSGKELPCEFSLYYSFIKASDPKNQNPKNILFLPGGPGNIVELEDVDPGSGKPVNALELLETIGHNVAYLHVRGSGFSKIPQPNKFDRFLRADYVVEDIERVRLKLLRNDTPWDAIWGESHGALIAQKYAYKYGTDKVKKLILVGPPSRSDETHDPRRKMTVSNLEAILTYYRNNTSEGSIDENAENDDSVTREIIATNDFSFLTGQTILDIGKKLGNLLKKLEEEFGSINFVIENYHDLQLEYPLVFFKALKNLAFNGAPAPVKGLEFEDETVKKQVDVAILIANYLMLPPRKPGDRRAVSEKTLAPLFMSRLDPDRLANYTERLARAHDRIEREISSKSQRALWVFGVYDGISRWILKFMNDKVVKDGFFRSEDIAPALTPATRYFAKKIGMVPGETIYPWNPGYYKHGVPTLILKGGTDAVIAGNQAESFYKDGLSNKRDSVLMEIPGMGHFWRTSMPMATFGREENGRKKKLGRKVLQELANEFLTKPSAAAFLGDRQVKEIIKSLRIEFPAAPQPREAELAKPKVEKLERRKLWDAVMRLRRHGIPTPVEKNRRVRAKAPKTKFSRPRPKN
jgi:pimeloyl-ACP methyl ester carboxylesterase